LTGTIFQSTKVDIEVWLMVMVQMCSAKNGISAREIERMHGVTPETAWFILHRLREAMKRDPLASAIRGVVVVADETWIGGEPKNMHANKRPKRGKGFTDQTPVLSLVSIGLDSREVRSTVVPNVRGKTLRKEIENQVVLPEVTLHTDSAMAYRELGPQAARHVMVNHKAGEYVKRGAGTNAAENYFSQLKRSIDGTYHVSRKHLPRYLDEFDFRYSTCKMSDGERLQKMVDQSAGRRLTYKPLKGQ
jgi:transposase-like protein